MKKLDNLSYDILKYIYKVESRSYLSLSKKFSSVPNLTQQIIFLVEEGYMEIKSFDLDTTSDVQIGFPDYKTGIYAITPDGRAASDSHNYDRMKFWIPTSISIIAFLFSVLALYISINSVVRVQVLP